MSDGAGRYTVTWLEMTERSAEPRRAMPRDDLILMRAHDPTVRFFRYLYDAVGSDYEWTDLHAWTDDAIAGFVQSDKVHLHVAYVGGTPAGFVQLDFRSHPVAEIAYFGLMPHAVSLGLGSWLLLEGIHKAWDTGIDKLIVNTCTLDHPRALPLYRKMGFETVRKETHLR